MKKAGLHLLLCVALIYKTDAYYGYGFMRFQFHSEDGHDVLYTAKLYFNKQPLLSYNSTEEKYVGYTKEIKNITDGLNTNKHFLEQERKNLQEGKEAAPMLFEAFKTAVKKPEVRVFSAKTPGNFIICSAYNFYPKPITLTWLKNGKEVMSHVISTDEMSNGNWLYQKHSYLEYTPFMTDSIQCMVEHASLPTPELHKWEYPESKKTKVTVGTAGLLLGLAFATAGIIYYLKQKRVRRSAGLKRGHQ